jgi:hypothetical protein
MQKFTDEILVESSADYWILKRAFKFYYSEIDNWGKEKKTEIVIPENFVTDFASTPSLLYPIFPPIGIYNKAAMVHDYLYSKYCPHNISRKISDKFFLQAMQVLEVPAWKRWAMYLAVRAFGKYRFKRGK